MSPKQNIWLLELISTDVAISWPMTRVKASDNCNTASKFISSFYLPIVSLSLSELFVASMVNMEDSRARASRSRRPASSTATVTVSCEIKEPTTASLGNLVTESHSTEWTDEKHSLYLKSMETSFVNQLYESMDLLGFCRLSDPTNSRKKHFSTLTPSGQFKVHRNGNWQRINFERAADLQLKKEDESDGFLANPWIQHFRPGCTPDVVASADVRKKAASTSPATCYLKQIHASHSHTCHHNLVGSDTEVSDQNFVEEEVKGENESQMCNAKRTKSLAIDASSNDQVVPLNESSTAEDATKNCISAARETMSPVTGRRQKTRLTT